MKKRRRKSFSPRSSPAAPPPPGSSSMTPARAHQRFLAGSYGDGLEPRNLDEAMMLAQKLSDSQLVPKDYRGKPGDILIAISLGRELGLKWAQALQSIAVIGGRPALWGDAGLALVMQHPDYEWHKETDDAQAQRATCTIKRRGLDPVTRSFAHADAERITVWERDAQGNARQVRLADRPVWKAGYAARMRQMRARWWALRDVFPDALKGIEGREWVEDDLAAREELPGGAPALRPEDVMPRRRPPEDDAGIVATVPAPPFAPPSRAADSEPALAGHIPSQGVPAGGREGSPAIARAEPNAAPVAGTGQPERKTGDPADAGQRPLPPAPPGGTIVEINGRQIATAGITKATLLQAFKLGARLDELTRKGHAKEVLGREYGLTHRHELTEPAGQQYVAALAKLVNQALESRR